MKNKFNKIIPNIKKALFNIGMFFINHIFIFLISIFLVMLFFCVYVYYNKVYLAENNVPDIMVSVPKINKALLNSTLEKIQEKKDFFQKDRPDTARNLFK